MLIVNIEWAIYLTLLHHFLDFSKILSVFKLSEYVGIEKLFLPMNIKFSKLICICITCPLNYLLGNWSFGYSNQEAKCMYAGADPAILKRGIPNPRQKGGGGFHLYVPIQMHWSSQKKGSFNPRNPHLDPPMVWII